MVDNGNDWIIELIMYCWKNYASVKWADKKIE